VERNQGEDKPSPLLWTKWLQPPLSVMEGTNVHSRGDGLSSPICTNLRKGWVEKERGTDDP